MVLKWLDQSQINLKTLREGVDYAVQEAHTTYGRIGIKVWIMKGEVYGKRELSPLVGMSKKNNQLNTGFSQRKKVTN